MPAPDLHTHDRDRAGRVLGWVAVIGVLVCSGLLVAALAMSLVVDGSSMEPTLQDGDRVLLDPRAEIDDLERFDIVHALVGPGRTSVVKRVIGLPGDRVAIRPAPDGSGARVWLRPAGGTTWQRVVNDVWQGAAITGSCCTDEGTSAPRARVATVPEGHVFLLGDNLAHSDDSRVFGWVAAHDVKGVFVLRLYPFEDFGPLPGSPRLVPSHSGPPGHGAAS